MPKVLVGVPVYNEARYIKHTIAALRAQDATDVRFMVCDNCSTDGTYELAEDYAAGDARFSFHRHERNLGAAANFDFSLRAADSLYFMWLGGHDVMSSNTINALSSVLGRDPSISMAVPMPHQMDEDGIDLGVNRAAIYAFDGHPLGRFMTSAGQLEDCTMFHSMFRTGVMQEVGIKSIYGPDLVFISTLLWHGSALFDENCAYYRRTFLQERSTTVTERLLGEGAKPDMHAFAEAYRGALASLDVADGPLTAHLRELSDILAYRFGPECALPTSETHKKAPWQKRLIQWFRR